jgi:hypothetical protein
MNTRGRAERVYLFLVAPTSKGLPGQRLDVALHKIHPHIYEQNSMSSECRHSSCLLFVYRQSFPSLMSLPVDAGGSSNTDRFHEWGIHGLERVNVQF